MMLRRQKDNLRTEEEHKADLQPETLKVFLYDGEEQITLFPLVDNQVSVL